MKLSTRTRLGAVALAAAIVSTAPSAQAAVFGVRVVDDTGAPVVGAAVCVGLQGNYKQFGAMFTDSSGTAKVDVPNVPLLVTVSKDRTAGVRMSEPARGYNLIKQVKLIDGVPGPRCRAGSSLATPDVQQILIDNVAVREGIYSTTLNTSVRGNPSHYRVSDNEGFTDAKWHRFSKVITTANYPEAEILFLQMRRIEGTAKSWLEARSDVIEVRMNPLN
ncbi:MAG: hypothetical protein V3U65_04815 [Granulosicoccaceae bacterium]